MLRFLQGLAVGGQWGGAVLAGDGVRPRRANGVSTAASPRWGFPSGSSSATRVFLVLTALIGEAAFAAWGWRIPFLLSVILIGVALYIQLRLEDTPVFRQLEERQAAEGEEAESGSPVLEVLRDHPKQMLLAAGAFFVVNGAFYVLITGMLDYGTRILGVSQNMMLAAVLISSCRPDLLPDVAGRRSRTASDAVPCIMAGAALLGHLGFPHVLAREHESRPFLITLALVVGQFFLGMMYGPQAALFSEMFSARVRYSGASIGYQGASVFAGGLAPDHHGLAAGCHGHLALGLLLRLRDGRRHLRLGLPDHRDLRGRDDPGTRSGRPKRRPLRRG